MIRRTSVAISISLLLFLLVLVFMSPFWLTEREGTIVGYTSLSSTPYPIIEYQNNMHTSEVFIEAKSEARTYIEYNHFSIGDNVSIVFHPFIPPYAWVGRIGKSMIVNIALYGFLIIVIGILWIGSLLWLRTHFGHRLNV